ncbi:hypothetical protein RJ641_003518 [Dillenia turbinata]|uniref:Protein SLOW GREEN 1, chloroplastic n=1 Tax=Dillenia turbinata TaxID=194707 RepID=A0AAN8ZEC2_9MAGN
MASSTSFFHFSTGRTQSPFQPQSLPSTLCLSSTRRLSIIRSSYSHFDQNPLVQTLKTSAKTLIPTTAATALAFSKFPPAPVRAEPSPTLTTEHQQHEEEQSEEQLHDSSSSSSSPLSQFLESHQEEAPEALKSLLLQKREDGEDEETLKILRKLVSAQPFNSDYKFLLARLLSEMGDTDEARQVFESILADNPLSFEALFENALLMDRCGEGEAVIRRLEEALKLAEDENKEKEARDVKLIMAQILFLQKNVDEALKSYDELAKEDPSDFRPYFCQGMIYSLMDRNEEAREKFKKYRELSPKKFEVEGFLRTPLSRMKLFGTDSSDLN